MELGAGAGEAVAHGPLRDAQLLRRRAVAAVMRRQSRAEVLSDVNGSYTGTPVDYEKPVQDADDL